MAYIRRRVVKTKDGMTESYQVLESYREGKMVRKRILCNLGSFPTIEAALDVAEQLGDTEKIKLFKSVGERMKVKGGVSKPHQISKRGVRKTIAGDVESAKSFPKRRSRAKPIPPEVQEITDEIKHLLDVKADEEAIIEKVVELKKIDPWSVRRWLSWMDFNLVGRLIKEAKRRIPRESRGFGPSSNDLLPHPREGEVWGPKYWKEVAFDLLARKIRGGGGPHEIAKKIFPHYWKSQRVTLAQSSLVFHLLSGRRDRSVDVEQFILEYQGSDYHDMVNWIRRKGERDGHSRLTAEDVREIRQKHEKGATLKALGEAYHVGKEAIWKVIHRRSWKHVEEKEAQHE